MPYTMTDFERDFTREHLYLLPLEERLQGLPLDAKKPDRFNHTW
jgi:hypothetical protein